MNRTGIGISFQQTDYEVEWLIVQTPLWPYGGTVVQRMSAIFASTNL